MAISTSAGNFWSAASHSDIYDGQRYYAEQERRYREQMDRHRNDALQRQMGYNPYTDTYGGMSAQQMQETKQPVKAQTPDYTDNKNLLLLGEA